MAKASILPRTEEYSESVQAMGFKDSFKRSKVSLRSGTGSRGKEGCEEKVSEPGKGSGAADFQSVGRMGGGTDENILLVCVK